LTETNIGYEETIKHIGIKMGPHLHLIVKDEGVGMESSVLERIFEPYYTTKSPAKAPAGAFGHSRHRQEPRRVHHRGQRRRQGQHLHVYLPKLDDAEVEIERTFARRKPRQRANPPGGRTSPRSSTC